MIFNTIIQFIVSLGFFVCSLLPNADPNITNQITNSTTNFRTAISAASWIFPVDSTLAFLAAILTIESVIIGFKLTRWIASMISAGLIK